MLKQPSQEDMKISSSRLVGMVIRKFLYLIIIAIMLIVIWFVCFRQSISAHVSPDGLLDFTFKSKLTNNNTKNKGLDSLPANFCLNAEFSAQHAISIWTMLTDNKNYVLGAIKLGLSVLRHTTLPVDLVILELKSKPLSVTHWTNLYRVGWKRCVVNRIAPKEERRVVPRFRDQYTKLHLWRMTTYDTVIYFDSDVFVIGNIDTLLKTDLESYSIGVSRDIRGGKWVQTFNMGVFVINPNKTEYQRLIKLKNTGSVKFDPLMSEQAFLNAVYKNKWFEIGFIYNANLAAYSEKPRDWKEKESNIRVIHYTMAKPWECGGVYSKVCKLWTNATGLYFPS